MISQTMKPASANDREGRGEEADPGIVAMLLRDEPLMEIEVSPPSAVAKNASSGRRST